MLGSLVSHLTWHLVQADYKVVRPFLVRYAPHKIVIFLYSLGRPLLTFLLKHTYVKSTSANIKDDPVEVRGLHFRNDLGNAAGFDKDGDLLALSYTMGAGYAVVGTVLDSPHRGNPLVRLLPWVNPWCPLPHSHSAINSLGLPSKGYRYAVKNIITFREKFAPVNFPIGVSVMGHPLRNEPEKSQHLITMAEDLLHTADFLEINESCPNTAHDDSTELQRRRLEQIVATRNRHSRYVPVFVKLASIEDPAETLTFYENLGIDGIVLTNTQKEHAHFLSEINEGEKELLREYSKTYQGGLSGQAISSYSFSLLEQAATVISERNLSLQLIHVGGIRSAGDIERSRRLKDRGVVLRQWYTGLFESLANNGFTRTYRAVLGRVPSEPPPDKEF